MKWCNPVRDRTVPTVSMKRTENKNKRKLCSMEQHDSGGEEKDAVSSKSLSILLAMSGGRVSFPCEFMSPQKSLETP